MPILLPHDVYEQHATRLSPGTLVHNRYQVICLLGHGHRGAVYKATDTQRRVTVALKQTLLMPDDERDLLQQEARALMELRHRCLPVVTDHLFEGDTQFLVMQFVPGPDLAATLRERKKSFPRYDVLHWARALLDALAYLHGQPRTVVHGDIKPSNLKPVDGGDLALLDFGLSTTRLMRASSAIADGGSAKRDAGYAAPERLEGGECDGRSDLYSLGATLYHLLTGTPPPSAFERVAATRAGQRDPLQHAVEPNQGLQSAIGQVVARAMALDPAERFASAHDMRRSLDGAETSAMTGAQSPAFSSTPRRVDVAAPSWVADGQSLDLFVQVRFFESPRLGREDWPVELRDTGIRQSNALGLVFPARPGAVMAGPALLRAKVVAPDFVTQETSEQLIEVPPDDYSARAVFRLATNKSGLCRMEVQLYSEDNALVGTVPVDVRVGGELARPPLKIGHLVLEVER